MSGRQRNLKIHLSLSRVCWQQQVRKDTQRARWRATPLSQCTSLLLEQITFQVGFLADWLCSSENGCQIHNTQMSTSFTLMRPNLLLTKTISFNYCATKQSFSFAFLQQLVLLRQSILGMFSGAYEEASKKILISNYFFTYHMFKGANTSTVM